MLNTKIREEAAKSHVDLSNSNINAEILTQLIPILQANQRLEWLNLNYNAIGNAGVKALAEGLEKTDSLKELHLHGAGIQGEGFKDLVKILSHNPQLVQLDLGESILDKTAIETLSPSLSTKSFTGLHFHGCQINGDTMPLLVSFLKASPGLETLNLNHNLLGNAGVKALAEGLQGIRSLKGLHLHGAGIASGETMSLLVPALQASSSLAVLNLNHNPLGNAGIKALAEGLKATHSLKELHLYKASIHKEGFEYLAEILSHSPHLAQLDLGENNLDLNSLDGEGFTLLSKAIYKGHEAIVKLLLAKKVDINLKNKHGDTPLTTAVVNGKEHLVQMLIEAKADVNLQDGYRDTPLTKITKAPLHGKVSAAIAQLLIDNGADVNLRDGNKDTPLTNIVQKRDFDSASEDAESYKLTIIKALIAAGADPHIKNIAVDKSAKQLAEEAGYHNLVDYLHSIEKAEMKKSSTNPETQKKLDEAVAEAQKSGNFVLNNVLLTDEEVEYLAKTLPKLKNLRQLGICACGLNAVNMKKLAPAIAQLTSLTSLSLNHNPMIGNEGLSYLTGIEEVTKLTAIHLHGIKMSDVGLKVITPFLKQNPDLSHIALGNNALTGGAVADLLVEDLPTHRFVGLHLDNCNINTTNMKKLAQAISRYADLDQLNLSYNPIGNEGLSYLASAENITKLGYFHMHSIGIDDVGLKAITFFLEQNLDLTDIGLEGRACLQFTSVTT